MTTMWTPTPTPDRPTRRPTRFVLAVLGVAVLAGIGLLRALPDHALPIATGTGDGRVGDRVVTIDDSDEAAIARLDPALRDAVAAATRDAAAAGVTLRITSGWRSPEYQQQLLDDAVATYGSVEEARRWVNTPEESTHVTGHAVDIGPTDAAYWMLQHGATYGLCQVYANEVWHFELLTPPGGSCPDLRADGASPA